MGRGGGVEGRNRKGTRIVRNRGWREGRRGVEEWGDRGRGGGRKGRECRAGERETGQEEMRN